MTKSLEEIQQENRRLILEAIHGCSYEEALEKEAGYSLKMCFGDKNKVIKPVTLSQVLLALTHKDISQPKPEIKFYNGYIITINGYPWGLTNETLEEQNEETQRAVYQLLSK
jgi:hypothetical protein